MTAPGQPADEERRPLVAVLDVGPHRVPGVAAPQVHRLEAGGLSEIEIERLGKTLMALDQRMTELCDHFGLTKADLNLDLGPLGRLL